MARPDVSAERKLQILDAATEVFVRKGIEAARMEDIAQAAGLSVGGVYWYFAGKDEVIHALLETLIGVDLALLRGLVDGKGSVRARLHDYVQAAAALASAQQPLTYELLSRAGREEAAARHLRHYAGAYQATLVAMLQQGIDRGEFVPFDVGLMAKTLMALIEGLAELAYIGAEGFATPATQVSALDLVLSAVTRIEAAHAQAASRYGGKWANRR